MINAYAPLEGNPIIYSTFADVNLKVEKSKMTSIKTRINRTHFGDDRPYPVVIQILRHRQKREISTPFRLYEDELDPHTGLVIYVPCHNRSSHVLKAMNRYLLLMRADLESIVSKLYRDLGELYTASDVADVYRRRRDRSEFFVYAESLINQLCNTGRESTAANYRSACNSLAGFLEKRALSFKEFTPQLVERFVEYQKTRGIQENSIMFYLRQLRAIYNKAVKEHIVHLNLEPFRDQAIKKTETRKRALSAQNACRVNQIDLTGLPEGIRLARDLFMGSLHLHGMAFVDMCYLTKENIKGDYICYHRRKTGQYLEIRIEKPLKELLARYADPDSPYLFPMLRGGTNLHQDYRNALNRLGKYIRQLGLLLRFNFPLTFYVARHTWATLAFHGGVEVSVISSSLGHTSEKTTRIYLASMDIKKVNRAHLVVIKSLRDNRI